MATGTIAAITAVGTAAAGAAAVGSAVTGAVNSSKNRAQNQENFESSQRFASEEAQKTRDWESSEWSRRFQIESEYNTPGNQVIRLADAGLNAQSLYGDSGSAGQVFGVSSNPSAPSAVAPAAPYNEVKNVTPFDVLDSLSRLVSSTAGAFKDTAQGESIAKTIDGMVKNLDLKNVSEALDIANKQIEVYIKGHTGLQKAWNDLLLQYGDIQLKAAMGRNYDAQNCAFEAEAFLKRAQGELSLAEFSKLQQIMPYVVMAAKKQISVLDSEVRANNASAAESHSRAALTDTQNSIAKIDQRIKEDPSYKKNVLDKMRADIDKVLSDKSLTDSERQRTLELKKMLEKENAWKNFNEIWDKVTDVADIGLDVFRTFTFQNFFNSESSRKKARDAFDMEHYGDVTETDNFSYYDSQGRKHHGSVFRKRAPKKR